MSRKQDIIKKIETFSNEHERYMAKRKEIFENKDYSQDARQRQMEELDNNFKDTGIRVAEELDKALDEVLTNYKENLVKKGVVYTSDAGHQLFIKNVIERIKLGNVTEEERELIAAGLGDDILAIKLVNASIPMENHMENFTSPKDDTMPLIKVIKETINTYFTQPRRGNLSGACGDILAKLNSFDENFQYIIK